MRNFDLLVFDFDGTLVDSSRDISHCLSLAFSDVGFAVPEEALWGEMGHPVDHVWGKFVETPAEGSVFDAFVQRYRHYHSQFGSSTTAPFPEVMETLGRLQFPAPLSPLPLAIATTKPTFRVVEQAKRFGLSQYFQCIQGTDGFPPKPDPEILRRVLGRFSVPPNRVLMVGDTERDVGVGKAVGCATAAVTWGARDRAFLEGLKPDVLLDSFSQVLEWV